MKPTDPRQRILYEIDTHYPELYGYISRNPDTDEPLITETKAPDGALLNYSGGKYLAIVNFKHNSLKFMLELEPAKRWHTVRSFFNRLING